MCVCTCVHTYMKIYTNMHSASWAFWLKQPCFPYSLVSMIFHSTQWEVFKRRFEGGVINFILHSSSSSVAQLCPTLPPGELQHTRPACPSPAPRVHPNPCPLSWWCHPTISSSVIPFSTCPQSFPASGSFQMSQFFASGGQSIGVSVSTSVLPLNIYDCLL